MRISLIQLSLLVGFAVISLVSPTQVSAQEAKFPVLIHEACIMPKDSSRPRWVELKSYSDIPLDLKGWTIWDGGKKIFTFEGPTVLEPGKLCIVCFYEGNKASSEFDAELPKSLRVHRCFTCAPFTSHGEFCNMEILANDSKDVDLTRFVDDLSKSDRDSLTIRARDYIKKHSLEDENLLPIMYAMANFEDYYGEIALCDKESKLISYVNWKPLGSRMKSEEYHWQAKAEERGIWERCVTYQYLRGPMLDNDLGFELEHPVRLRHCSPICFVYTPSIWLSPGRLVVKGDLKEFSSNAYPALYEEGKTPFEPIAIWLSAGSQVASNSYPWCLQVEASPKTEFSEVVYWGSKQFDRVAHGYSIKITDRFELRRLMQFKELHFRARRLYYDGTESEWTVGKEPIRWERQLQILRCRSLDEYFEKLSKYEAGREAREREALKEKWRKEDEAAERERQEQEKEEEARRALEPAEPEGEMNGENIEETEESDQEATPDTADGTDTEAATETPELKE